MKTLYLSDLDGTLIRSNEMISEFTANIVNRFVKSGGCFSYATARSIVTAEKVTAGLNAEFPVICHNGVFIISNTTKDVLSANFFSPVESEVVQKTLTELDILPITYAYIDGKEQFSYVNQNVSDGMRFFLDSRLGDPRRREVETVDDLYHGSPFYFSCISDEPQLSQVRDIFEPDKRFHCIYQKDIYSGAMWCELLPAKATKANAALQLKIMLDCDRMVVFGDNKNDMSLFSVADEKYAMSNAVPELKEMATAVIGSNDCDGVAKWLEGNVL